MRLVLRPTLCLALSLTAALGGWAAGPGPTVSSDTHGAFYNDFESTPAPLAARPVGRDEPPTMVLTRVSEAGRGKVLRATNSVSGGYVGVNLLPPGRPMPAYSRLSFDYKADATLKANLFCRVQSVDYEIGFCGPRSDTGLNTWLGQLPDVKADGQWHHIDIPLLRLLRLQLPMLNNVRISELCFENRCQADYLLAGFGGNPAGATLSLDNVQIVRVGGPTAHLMWQPAPGTAPEGYAVVVDGAATTEPKDVTTPKTELDKTFEGLKDGEHWAHVRAFDGQAWSETTHYRFEVNTEPPTAALVEPANGSTACPKAVRVKLVSRAAGIAPNRIEIKLAGQELRVENAGVSYDPVSEELAIDLSRLEHEEGKSVTPVIWGDGQKLDFSVNCTDENGIALVKPLDASFTMRFAADKTAPEGGRLLLAWPGEASPTEIPGEGTFENGVDEWMAHGNERVVVERTDRTAASGKYSLRVMCTENGSDYTTYVRRSPFDVGRFRVVSFDYKADPRLRLDFVLRVGMADGEKYVRVIFTDRDNDGLPVGRVPDVVADNEWHHAEFNLYDMLRSKFPNQTSFRVQGMLLTGGKWSDTPRRFPGNYAGTEVYFDNFFFVPTVSADAKLVWQGHDVSGLAGARVSAAPDVAQLPTADAEGAGRRVEGPATALADFGSGLTYLWVRPFDRAGNLAAPMLTRAVIAGGRPEIASFWPAPDGARVAPSTLGVKLRYDRAVGIDPSTITLEVDGRPYNLDSNTLSFDAATGTILWDGRRSEPQTVLPDGKTVTVKLLSCKDQAGNSPAAMPSWKFSVDYKLDKTGPVVKTRSRTHTATWYDDFLDPALQWSAKTGDSVQIKRVPIAGSDGQALSLVTERANAPYAVWHAFDSPYSLLRFGHLIFDYKIAPGVDVDLLLRLRNEDQPDLVRALKLTDAATDVARPGAIAGVVADDQWHRAIVPVMDLLRGDDALPAGPQVKAIGFGDQGPSKAQVGRGFQIANIYAMRPATSATVRLDWTALDETGVKGYSYVVDQNPRTTPQPQVMTQETELRLRDIGAKLAWFHIRAVDGSGNWGPTTHFPLLAP
ncbi:MAG: hypothetical protein HZB16_19730 [Armatimonadetes bacterium]|nr:hypothetical protein [Armatimonadota bacterium]